MPSQMASFVTSSSKVGASNRVMLVIPTILTTILLAPGIYSAAFSFMVRPWVSAHFFVGKVMATTVPTIMRPLVASPLG